MSDCESIFKWLTRRKATYQPIRGFEHKVKPKRIAGFKKILKTIVDHCGSVEGEKFLDIGSCVGYFCFNLTNLGAQTTGVELIGQKSAACKCVAARDGYDVTNPHFINDNAVDWVRNTSETFDYIILLNVFHHILLHDESGGWEMFNKLINTTKGIFVMMRNSLKQKRDGFKHWSLCSSTLEIPQAVLDASDATDFIEYPAVHGRVIYFFWKQ